jgi:hypothetical protein
MPPKNKKEVDENDLPPIDRIIVKVVLMNQEERKQELVQRFTKAKRKDVLFVTRDKVLEFAEANAIYIRPENIDPKKKLPEGVQTTMTTGLMLEM